MNSANLNNADLYRLCRTWRPGDAIGFARILKLSLEFRIVTAAQFRDGLSVAPANVVRWVRKVVQPHPLMQRKAIDLVRTRIEISRGASAPSPSTQR